MANELNMTLFSKRLKEARTDKNMTQKELGLAVGFSESTADIRIGQYESVARAPKEQLLH